MSFTIKNVSEALAKVPKVVSKLGKELGAEFTFTPLESDPKKSDSLGIRVHFLKHDHRAPAELQVAVTATECAVSGCHFEAQLIAHHLHLSAPAGSGPVCTRISNDGAEVFFTLPAAELKQTKSPKDASTKEGS